MSEFKFNELSFPSSVMRVILNLSLVKYGLPYIKEQTDLLHNTSGRIYEAYLFISFETAESTIF